MQGVPTIRVATVADLEDVVRLRLAFLYEFAEAEGKPFPESLPAATRQFFEQNISGTDLRVWLAEWDSKRVGCCAASLRHGPPSLTRPSGLTVHLFNVYTVPERRRRGIASALVTEAVDYARKTGSSRLGLHASAAGRGLYERLGFQARDDEMILAF